MRLWRRRRRELPVILVEELPDCTIVHRGTPGGIRTMTNDEIVGAFFPGETIATRPHGCVIQEPHGSHFAGWGYCHGV